MIFCPPCKEEIIHLTYFQLIQSNKNFPQHSVLQYLQRENKKKIFFNSRNLENSNKILYSCVTQNQILYLMMPFLWGSLLAQSVKNLTARPGLNGLRRE